MFVQHQPFQLHLPHQEFPLDKLVHNGREDARSGGEERVMSKSRPAAMKISYFVATSSSTASSPSASKSTWMPIASWKPNSRMSIEPSSFDAASTRHEDAYLGGLMEKQLASRRRFRRLRQSCGWDLVLRRRTTCPKLKSVGETLCTRSQFFS